MNFSHILKFKFWGVKKVEDWGDTLGNRFTERYETRGRQRVRSREGAKCVGESSVLEKKKE
jgi:hypothetical protein